jgi:hypothetical protein
MSKRKYRNRIVAAAGSLAGLASTPSASEGSLVTVTGSPVSLATSAADGTSVAWDVDGVGASEFRWRMDGATIFLASDTSGSGQGNGRGLVAPFNTDNVQAQLASSIVGAGNFFGFGGGSASNGLYRYRNAMSAGGGIGYDFNYGFAPGDNLVGFRFDDGVGGGLNYGWAVFNFDTTAGIASITSWTYETIDDLGVHVGTTAGAAAVPEPSSLALLACGAAGLLSYRGRRKATNAAGELSSDLSA